MTGTHLLPRGLCMVLAFLLGSGWGLGSSTSQVKGAIVSPNEVRAVQHDLDVGVDTAWPGGATGGYYPIHVRLLNRGETRTLTFRVVPVNPKGTLPRVERTISAAQNATEQFSLLVPMTSTDSLGRLEIVHDGKPLPGLSMPVSFPAASGNVTPSPSLLIISPKPFDAAPLELACQTLLGGGPSGGMSRGGYGFGHTAAEFRSMTLHPERVPETWLAYFGIDMVAISAGDLAKLGRSQRTAILKWARAGGTLLILETGKSPAESSELSRLLLTDWDPASEKQWVVGDVSRRRRIDVPIEGMSGIGDARGMARRGLAGMAGLPGGADEKTLIDAAAKALEETLKASRDASVDFVWSEQAFSVRPYEFGKVVAFRENPFPGSVHDWTWMLSEVDGAGRWWPNVYGISARDPSLEFSSFKMPHVNTIPPLLFLALMTGFTLLIGPINFIVLMRKKRSQLLLLTIPGVALLTSFLLFTTSILLNGFGTKSSARSLTLLDQRNKTAVSVGRIGLFAGLAPSKGISFSSETAVVPISNPDDDPAPRTVNWSDDQNLREGWLRSRTQTQFLVVRNEDVARGRLEIDAPSQGSLAVSNGFETDVLKLLVADEQGKLYGGDELAAGASARLSEANSSMLSAFRNAIEEHDRLFRTSQRYGRGYSRRMMHYMGSSNSSLSFDRGLLNQRLKTISEMIVSTQKLPPRTYVALVRHNPHLEMGVATSKEAGSLHVIYGRY